MPTYPLTGSAAAELEARLANFRLAQTRLGFLNPTVRVLIAGTERQTQIDKHSIEIALNEDGPASASLTAYDGFTPVEGQDIKIAIGAPTNLLFAGTITGKKKIFKGGMSRNMQFALSCTDYSHLANRRLVQKRYNADNVESIIGDLIPTFTSGFTTTHVEDGLGFLDDGVTFTMETVEGALKRLARTVNAHFYWDPTKDLHFYSTDRVPNPHDLSSSYTDFEYVTHEVDLSEVITRVYVEGGGSITTAPWLFSGSILVEDNALFSAGAGLRLGNYMPIHGRTFEVFSLIGSTEIQLNFVLDQELIDARPAVETNGWPSGQALNIFVEAEDTAAQTALAALEGGDGIHERYIQDRRYNADGATERAEGELAANKNPIERLTYRTRDPNTRPGGRVTVNLSSPVSITGTFTIKTVKVNAIEQATNKHPWKTVTAVSQQKTLWDLLRESATFAQINTV